MPPKRSRLHKKKGARRPGSRASDASSASDDAMSTDGGGADDEGDEGGDNMERLLNHPTTTLPTASHPPATGARWSVRAIAHAARERRPSRHQERPLQPRDLTVGIGQFSLREQGLSMRCSCSQRRARPSIRSHAVSFGANACSEVPGRILSVLPCESDAVVGM